MKILALEMDATGGPSKKPGDELLKDEAACVWRLHQSGAIRELYFRADRRAAVLVLECTSVDEAKATLATLPLVREKIIEFELIPLEAYSGFARLFDLENLARLHDSRERRRI